MTHHENPTDGATLVTDPVCGMQIDPETAITTREHDGTTSYFCQRADHGEHRDPYRSIRVSRLLRVDRLRDGEDGLLDIEDQRRATGRARPEG